MAKRMLIPKVKSLGDLRRLAQDDARYAKLLVLAASNLGGAGFVLPSEPLKLSDFPQSMQRKAHDWLVLNANETNSERGVVAEVNACRDLV